MIGCIWAQARGGVVGVDGALPWHLPEDLARFRAVTLGSAVIMGRRTWESLPERFRPLPGRRNLVLSRRTGPVAPGADVHPDLATALAALDGADVWVIGGAQVWAEALPFADVVELTEIDVDVPGDAFAPELDAAWDVAARDPRSGWLTSRTGLPYRCLTYRRTRA